MFGVHYSVNGEKFNNYFSALKKSHETNSFAHFIIPDWHINKWKSVDIAHAMSKPLHYWMEKKLEYLVSKYKKIRLQYSGGTDSHTIITLALKKGIVFDRVWMRFGGLGGPESYSNEENTPGYHWLMKNPQVANEIELFLMKEKHFEIWFEKGIHFKIPAFDFKFRPHWRPITMLNADAVDINLYGHEKPILYKKNNQYYWVLPPPSAINALIEHISYNQPTVGFFLDGHVPELAVAQAYHFKRFCEDKMPNHQGWITWETIPESLRSTVNQDYLGRTKALTPELEKKTLNIGTKGMSMNEYHFRSMKEIHDLGRHDILEAWEQRRQELISEMQHIKHGIECIPTIHPITKKEILIPKIIARVALVIRLDKNKLTTVPVESIIN